MNRKVIVILKNICSILLLIFLFVIPAYPQDLIKGDALIEDFEILKTSLEALHPGLYKYVDQKSISAYFTDLKEEMSIDATALHVYQQISLFTTKIQCGHTYGNYWNQSKSLKEHFVNDRNKVPFTFRIIGKEVVIFQNLSNSEKIKTGDRIMSINGVSMDAILNDLVRYVKADGANDEKRWYDLQVFALDNFESFDIFLPFVLDLGETIQLEVKEYQSDLVKDVEVSLTTRKERYAVLTTRYGKQIESYDDYWNFEIINDNVAHLTVGTFVTWKMEIKWKKFLNEAFETIDKQNIENLIIDIRGNEGGNSDVQEYFYKQLRKTSAVSGPYQQTLNTNYVPEAIRPHLKTWSNDNFDLRKKTKKLDNGFYTFKRGGLIQGESNANKKAYQGNVYLLVDASNSSGTFFLIDYIKKNKLATVIGQTSGGNQQGITGGQIFVLRLPNSKIEVDIPVIGYYPLDKKPNKGIDPDIQIELSIEDLLKGKDPVLEKAMELIRE